MPSLHSHAVCKYHVADKDLINKAIECSLKAKKEWEVTPFEDKAAIFYRVFINLLD